VWVEERMVNRRERRVGGCESRMAEDFEECDARGMGNSESPNSNNCDSNDGSVQRAL